MKTLFGGSSYASDLAKSINSIAYERVKSYNSSLSDDQIKQLIVDNFNTITGLDASSYSDVEGYLGDNGEAIYAYYEYYQFKKGLFECTGITYDSIYGRVETITFEYTGKIH